MLSVPIVRECIAVVKTWKSQISCIVFSLYWIFIHIFLKFDAKSLILITLLAVRLESVAVVAFVEWVWYMSQYINPCTDALPLNNEPRQVLKKHSNCTTVTDAHPINQTNLVPNRTQALIILLCSYIHPTDSINAFCHQLYSKHSTQTKVT